MATVHQLVVTRYQIMATRQQIMATRYQIMATRHQTVATIHQLMVPSYQIMATLHQIMVTIHQSLSVLLASGHHAPVTASLTVQPAPATGPVAGLAAALSPSLANLANWHRRCLCAV